MTNVEIRDARFRAVVGDSVTFEQLASGFLFTEGPLWDPGEGSLLFSDMPGDIIRRWTSDGVKPFRQPAAKSNGLAYDQQGRLLVCEHATSRVTRSEPNGASTVLASHWQGKALNSPNDIIVGPDGAIYFTDPTYGRMDHYGIKRDQELAFQGFYRLVAGSGTLELLADDFGQPNGLCFARDDRRILVNDTDRQHIRAFDIAGDGKVSGGGIWAETQGKGAGAPDGMKLDQDGNVYCCGPGGIQVFAPDATCLGVIAVPEYVANFCWGDEDYRSLFITASTSLYRIRTKTAGRPLV